MNDSQLALKDIQQRKEIQEMFEKEAADKRKLHKEKREFYEKHWMYYSSVRGKWQNVTELADSIQLSQQVNHPTTLQNRLSPRESSSEAASLVAVYNKIMKAAWFQRIQQPTQQRIDQKEQCGGLPTFPKMADDAIERYLLANLEFRSSPSGTADEYFNAKDLKGKPERAAQARYRRWGLTSKVFWRIAQYMTTDHSLLALETSSRLKKWVWVIGNVVLDESLVECEASDAPKVYISRKPHPWGLKFYLVCVTLPLSRRSLPIGIHPAFPETQLPISVLFERAFGNFRTDLTSRRFPFVITMDAYFSVNSLIENPPDPLKFIVSWNTARMKDLWKCMFYGLEPREFRMARSGNFICSAFRDRSTMAITTNAFTITRPASDVSASTSTAEPASIETQIQPIQQSQILCRRCLLPGELESESRSSALKCRNCEYGVHRKCNPVYLEPLSLFFCHHSCKVEFIRNLAEDYLPRSRTEGMALRSASQRQSTSEKCAKAISKVAACHLKELCLRFDVDHVDGSQTSMAYSLCGLEIPEPASTPPIPPVTPISDVTTQAERLVQSTASISKPLESLTDAAIKKKLSEYGVKPKSQPALRRQQLALL
ncbi:MAG: transposase, partial [Cyanobacteria bacterium]|nr:transposase [Cyanobacteriota bacterium]